MASDAGIGALIYLTETISREKFSDILPKEVLENYISKQFEEKKLIDDLNDMLSQQWLVVYANEYPVGYAKITLKGEKPKIGNKTSVRIADFVVLEKYDDPFIWSSLFAKCLSVTSFYDVIWINEYIGDPVIAYFEKMNFKTVFASGVKTKEEMIEIVRAVSPRPVNIERVFSGSDLPIREATEIGIRRISVGASFAGVALGDFYRDALRVKEKGIYK